MSLTDSTTRQYKKPKLPRKRKKAAIKAQGRKWYHDTIKFYLICKEKGIECEPICKFWVNASIKNVPAVLKHGTPYMIPQATRFW